MHQAAEGLQLGQANRKGVVGMAFLARRRMERAAGQWSGEIVKRDSSSKAFLDPRRGGNIDSRDKERPKIRKKLQGAPKAAAACFCQILSGHVHAIAAASLKDKWG